MSSSGNGMLDAFFDDVEFSFGPLRLVMLCFRLKVFNHTGLLAGVDAACSGPETEAKYCAFSRIKSSDNTTPFFCCFITQFESVFSISGGLPFTRLSGERTASVCFCRYFSFCRKTFDTVLEKHIVSST